MPPPPRRPNESPIPWIWYLSTALIGLVIVLLLLAPGQPRDSISYSTFETYLRDGRVAEVTVADRYIQGRLTAPLPDGRSIFVVTRVAPDIAGELSKYGVVFSGAEDSSLLRDLLSWAFPVLLCFGLWLLVYPRMVNPASLSRTIEVVRAAEAAQEKGLRSQPVPAPASARAS